MSFYDDIFKCNVDVRQQILMKYPIMSQFQWLWTMGYLASDESHAHIWSYVLIELETFKLCSRPFSIDKNYSGCRGLELKHNFTRNNSGGIITYDLRI